MTRALATNTTVGDTTYKAGTVPPEDVAKLITNPKAWADEPAPETEATPAAPPAGGPSTPPPSGLPSGPAPSAPPTGQAPPVKK